MTSQKCYKFTANLPGDAEALTPSDEVVGVMRFVEFPGLPTGETVVDELTLGGTEEVWVLLSVLPSATVTRAEETSCVETGVNIRDLDGEGETDTVVFIMDANKADDEAAVEVDDGISKETEKRTEKNCFDKSGGLISFF